MAEIKKGTFVKVKARTWSDYYDNLTIAYGPNKNELQAGCECVFDPRTKPPSYMTKRATEGTINLRCLFRKEFKEPITCIVVGWTTRQTGWRCIGSVDFEGGYAEPNYLAGVSIHRVCMVVDAESDRWSKPFSCTFEDMEIMHD